MPGVQYIRDCTDLEIGFKIELGISRVFADWSKRYFCAVD